MSQCSAVHCAESLHFLSTLHFELCATAGRARLCDGPVSAISRSAGLSPAMLARASHDVRKKWHDASPAAISGTMNPAQQDRARPSRRILAVLLGAVPGTKHHVGARGHAVTLRQVGRRARQVPPLLLHRRLRAVLSVGALLPRHRRVEAAVREWGHKPGRDHMLPVPSIHPSIHPSLVRYHRIE